MALIGTLNSGISALKVFTKDLEVIGDNIANVNTTSFKSSKVSIANDFSNTLLASSPGNGSTISSTSSAQVGTGSKIASIDVNYNQGALSTTNQTTDLGISGEGYYLVKDSTGNIFATRNGSFHWDDNGNLVNSKGYFVQGVVGDPASSTTVGNITKDATAVPAGESLESVSIDRTGQVVQFYSGGTNSTVGRVLLQQFSQQSSLMKAGDGLYTSLDNASPANGALFTATGATISNYGAGTNGNGTIESGTLELSNVDLTEQFSNLITAQRSFQAASRLVTVSDNVLEEIVNLKR
jgi:flagellar hook protein FlgE